MFGCMLASSRVGFFVTLDHLASRVTNRLTQPNQGMIPMRKPYYDPATNDFVFDEVCQCGHLKSEHGSMLVKLQQSGGSSLRLPDDGNCCKGQCNCAKFVWIRFVFTDEFADIVKSRRRVPTTV
jgi:hypothetical protein